VLCWFWWYFVSASAIGAVYTLPVPIWVTHETLGSRRETTGRGLPFEVRLPIRDVIDGVELLQPPQLPGLDEDDENLISSPWAMNYVAELQEPAMALCRVGLTCEVNAENANRSRFADGAALAFRVEDALIQRIEGWFADVRSWVEVVTGQDLDYRHRLSDAANPAEGLLIVRDGSLTDSGTRVYTTRYIRPVTSDEWTKILALVGNAQKPPTEYLLMRDAHAALARDQRRRAILDAATASELVLTSVLVKHTVTAPPQRRAEVLKRPRMLGGLISSLENQNAAVNLSWTELRKLSKLRNAAIHEGAEPDHLDAAEAITTAAKLVRQHGALAI
jgi:hypothetical protein